MELVCNYKLPKLTINSKNAQKFNEKIMSQFSSKDDCKSGFQSVSSSHVDYKYYLKDNTVFILVTQETNNYRGSGSHQHFGYYYDITNDKELSLEDIYKKYSITLDEVNNRIQSQNGVLPMTKLDQVVMPTINDNCYVVYVDTSLEQYKAYIYK